MVVAPNAALRWKPQPSQIAPDQRRKAGGDAPAAESGQEASAAKRSGAPQANSAEAKPPREDRKRVWVKDGDFVRPLKVSVGQSDGSMTEISGSDVKEGLRVVIGTGSSQEETVADGEATTSPFLPKMPKGHKPPPPPG